MCEPATIAAASLIIGGVSAAGGAVQQSMNQRRQLSYQNRMIRDTEINSAQSAAADYQALGTQQTQVRSSVALEAFEAARQAEVARGQLAVGAASTGVIGGNINDIAGNIARQLAMDSAVRRRNLSWQESQISRSFDQVRAQHQSRLNAAQGNPVPGVDWMGLVGGLAQTGLGYANFKSQQTSNQNNLRIPGQRG